MWRQLHPLLCGRVNYIILCCGLTDIATKQEESIAVVHNLGGMRQIVKVARHWGACRRAGEEL
jgi:hypothetical protein